MSAISLSNQVDFTHREEREKRYLELIRSYEKKEQGLFPQMFAHLVEALEYKVKTTGPEDVFGPIYLELEIYRKEKGQFFTPQHISDMMAKLTAGNDDWKESLDQQGFISMSEPSCGSGVMITSMCKAMKKADLNYCTQLVVVAVDVDQKCAFMTYLQLALYGVPAVVIHGNSITCKEFSRWYTPVYILNGWVWRFTFSMTNGRSREDEMIKCALEPGYAALRMVEGMMKKETAPDDGDIDDATQETVIGVPAPLPDQIYLAGSDVDFTPTKAPATQQPRRTRAEAASNAGGEQLSLFEGM
jgi:hypothetical protein